MTKKELSQLIQLAIIDGDLAEREGKIIFAYGKQQGFTEDEIKDLIKSPEPIGPIEVLSEDEKFHFLYMVVQMMKIDGQVYKSEIEFCKDLAGKLGFKKSVIGELSSRIYSDPTITADRDVLKKMALKYLK